MGKNQYISVLPEEGWAGLMNILMISSNYPPALGGPAASVPYLSKELTDAGHKVFVLTQGYPGHKSVEKGSGCTVYRTGLIPGKYYSSTVILKKILSMSKLCKEILKNHKIDVIHAHDPNISAMVGIIANWQHKIPSVVKYSGDMVWEFLSLTKWVDKTFEEFINSGSIQIRILKNLERFVLNKYDRVIAQSLYQKNVLENALKIGVKKISIVPNGVTCGSFDKNQISKLRESFGGGRIISTACRLVPWKGVKYLIESLKFLPDDVKIVIYGNGPQKEELNSLVKRLGLENRVIFYGKVDFREIQNYIMVSDVFALASVYEPSGIALLDAMIANVPVVAAKVGGMPEIIKDNKAGLTVNPRNPKDIAEKISILLRNRKLRDEIKIRQKIEVKEYLWPNLIKRYVELYEEL